jgi:Flp pilus assembly protein TadB
MIPLLLLATAGGVGAFLIWRALTARPSLADIHASLARPGRPAAAPARPTARDEFEHRVVQWTVDALRRVGADPAARAEDLAVTRSTVEQLVVAKLAWAAAGVALVAVGAAVLAAGGIGIVAGAVVVVALVAAAAGFVLPDLALTNRAREDRRAFRHALGAYLDLVDVMTAAGAGPETALQNAAEAGDGWVFEQIRLALDTARRSRRLSIWEALGELGNRLGIAELGQIAASASLVDTEGARIRESLAAQAEALRAAQLAEVEAEAESATERMIVPVVVLLIAFILFIGYPAVANISGIGQ